jgi:hypothetical protein
MPAPSSFYPSVTLPALYLYPIDDSFVPKHISLAGNQRVKIGRQTNAKSIPGERNGFFDSKVLSRQHAEVWEENGKVLNSYSMPEALLMERPLDPHKRREKFERYLHQW